MAVVLITGSSTGIGQEAALHLARKGHQVYAAVRSPGTATDLKNAIAAEALAVEVIQLDVVDPPSIAAAVATIMAAHGRIDAVVNNAGIGGGVEVEETPLEEARKVFETNYFGSVSVLQAVIPIMRKQGAGRIVNISSLFGRIAMGSHGHYTASKWALEGLSEALACEMAEFNVRVALIEPGVVMTPIWNKAEQTAVPSHYRKSRQRLGQFLGYGLQQPAMPADVALAIADAIESDNPRFRYPVGIDATATIAARTSVDDEEWMRANCLQGDEFVERMQALLGPGYYKQ